MRTAKGGAAMRASHEVVMLGVRNSVSRNGLLAPWLVCGETWERRQAIRTRQHVHEIARLARASVTRVLSRRKHALGCDADDLTQHVLAHLFANDARALCRWEQGYGVSYVSYVRMIAERAAISALRRRDHHPREEHPADPSVLDAFGDDERSIEDGLLERAHSRALVERLDRELTPCGRRVLRVLYAEGQSIEDASRSLGMSADALYTWRSRIRRHAILLLQDG